MGGGKIMARNFIARDKKTGKEIIYVGDILKIGDGAKIIIGDKEEIVLTGKILKKLLKEYKVKKVEPESKAKIEIKKVK